MKKKLSGPFSGGRIGTLFDSMSERQLALVGACALTFNELQEAQHWTFGGCINFPGPFSMVSSRINGSDGIVALISYTARAISLREDVEKLVINTLENGFGEVKSLRDAVIHARLIDMRTSIGLSRGRQAKEDIVLLSEDALQGLYHRLLYLKEELINCGFIIDNHQRISKGGSEKDIAQLEESIQGAIARLRLYQSQRLSLPPLPPVPDQALSIPTIGHKKARGDQT